MSTVTVLPTYAALPDTGETVQPMWDNTSGINITMDFFDDGYGYSDITVCGVYGVTTIDITIIVYKQVGVAWVQIAESQTTISGRVGGHYCRFDATQGETYRTVYSITVTKNGVDENITVTKKATCE